MFRLDKEVAIITGGASGIGFETVKRFRMAGAKIVIADMTDASALAKEVDGIFVKTDVSDEAQVEDLIRNAKEEFGRLDILVNNAGVFAEYNSLADTSESDLDYCYSINTKGVAWGLKYADHYMNEGGRIINTSSVAATQGVISLSSYVASKHAVIGLSKTAALELAHRKIRVNCVCPSTVDTPMAHEGEGEFLLQAEKKLVPLARICRPEEVAALIHFLAARDCDFVNGQAINIDGGMSAGITETAFNSLAS